MHANHTAADLVLEQLPSGEHAWLRPALSPTIERYQLDPERVVIVDQVEAKSDDERYSLTVAGRRELAQERLFGLWPSVAAARHTDICPACRQLQTAPSCATREHWL